MNVELSNGHTVTLTPRGTMPPFGAPEDGVEFMHYDRLHNVTLASGYTALYVGTNYRNSREVHVWYGNGNMWPGYGKNIKAALEGAIADAWLHS